nr:uracil-DNA glycosylase family protein [Chromobacterium sp. ASV5]
MADPLPALLAEIAACRHCADQLPQEPRPVLRAASRATILIAGQAPGRRAHASGVPWDDASGERLREWLGVDAQTFYNPERFAIVPMGFCFPGSGKSGDLPPLPACRERWHPRLLPLLPNLRFKLLIGEYAQAYYLPRRPPTLTATVEAWRDYFPAALPLPHPSPRNQLWLRRNPWFEAEVLPVLRQRVQQLLAI